MPTGPAALAESSLKGRLLFLLKDTAFYGIIGTVAKLASIFTLPILTRVLSTAEYGLVDGITIFTTIFLPVIILGQDSAIALFFYESEDPVRRSQVVSTGFALQTVLALAVTAVLLLNSSALVRMFLGSATASGAYRIAVAALPFVIVVRFATNLTKWTFQRRRFLYVTLGPVFATVALTVWFVVGFGWGIYGVFWANLAAHAVFAVVAGVCCREYLRPIFDRALLPKLLRIGVPFMVVGVASAVMPSVDRYFIANTLTLADLGTYAVALRVAGLLSLVVGAFQVAWGPFAFAIHKQPDARRTFAKVLSLFTFAATLAVLGIVAVGPVVVSLVASERYLAGTYLLAPLAFGILLGGLYYFPLIGVTLAQKTLWNAVAFFAGVAGAVVGNAVLVPRIGLLGAAIGIVAGQVIAIAVIAVATARVYPIPFDYIRCTALLASGAVLAIAMEYLPAPTMAASILVRFLCIATYLAVGWWGVLERRERRMLVVAGRGYIDELTGLRTV